MFAYCNNNPVNFVDPSGNLARFHYLMDYEGASACKIKEIIYAIDRDLTRSLQELRNYMCNEDESVVLQAKGIAFYKNKPVIKLPIGKNAAFYGLIFIGNDVENTNVVKHEYGHSLQWDEIGMGAYTFSVAIPSITINLLDRQHRLPYEYNSYPWEADANRRGGAYFAYDAPPLPEGGYRSYWDLIALFFR